MSYGSATFGSTVLGGVAASLGVFFSPIEQLARGVYRRSLEYAGDADFFQVETRRDQEETTGGPFRLIRVYSHNDLGESPQLRVTTTGDSFYSQSIIAAVRFIVVELELLDPWPLDPAVITLTITGSEYFQ